MFGIRIFAPFSCGSFFLWVHRGRRRRFWEGARGLLLDLGQAMANAVALHRIPVAIVQALWEESQGWMGPGSTGYLWWGRWHRLGRGAKFDIATLGALGQYFAIAVGADASSWAVILQPPSPGQTRRRSPGGNLFPCLMGFVGVIIVAILIM